MLKIGHFGSFGFESRKFGLILATDMDFKIFSDSPPYGEVGERPLSCPGFRVLYIIAVFLSRNLKKKKKWTFSF